MVTPPVRGAVGSAGLPIQHRRTGAQSNSRSPPAPRLRFWSAFPARMLAQLLERRAADAARRRAQRATQRAAELQAATAQLRAVERALVEGEEDEVVVGQAAANACHCPPLEVPAVKVVVLVKVLFVVK